MRIDAYLACQNLANSRSRAKELIENGRVLCNGVPITKPSYDVPEYAAITILPSDKTEYVSRGGKKLEAALDAFGVDPRGLLCADIGASTGGFTDVLLRRGAEKVFAIDSGTGQLVDEIRKDPRVICLENTNARYLTTETLSGESVSLVVMDVSFISQKLLYHAIGEITLPGADIITLIKPQFEAGKAALGKHGIVKDEKVRRAVIEDIQNEARLYGFTPLAVIESPIKGGSGNTEYLIHLKKGE